MMVLATMSTMMMVLSCLMQSHRFFKSSKAAKKWEDDRILSHWKLGNGMQQVVLWSPTEFSFMKLYSLEERSKMCWKYIQLPTFSIITLIFRLFKALLEERLAVARNNIAFSSHCPDSVHINKKFILKSENKGNNWIWMEKIN